MTERQQAMIRAFVEYERTHPHDESSRHNVIFTPIGTRLQRIIRLRDGWRLWVATADFIHGTSYELRNDGTGINLTTRVDEGDDEFVMRPSDETIRSK